MLALAAPHAARAQVGASVTLQTDYRYRGYSLTDRRPAVALNLSFDHEGFYAGGTAFAADTPQRGVRVRGEIAYAGYATKTSLGPGVDFGVSHTRFISYRGGKRAVEFDEVYAGVVGDHLSARLAYSPRYLDQDVETLYLDLGAAYRPAPDWRLFAHAGAFIPVSGREYPVGRRKRYDLSAGVARRIRRTELSLYWTHLSPVLVYPDGRRSEHDALVASATYFF
jgi:uncharacterized protein (TIGR02001 family)